MHVYNINYVTINYDQSSRLADRSSFDTMDPMKWVRKQITWIASVAVGGMILWLAFSATTLQRAQEGSAGILFDRPVPAQEYRRSLEAVLHEALLRFGDRYRQQVPEEQLQQQAWERLILLTEARRLGLRVSDGEVIQQIQKIPIFQTRDGPFDRPGYEAAMRYSLGTTPRAYEEEVRDDLAIRKLFERAIGTPQVTEAELLQGFHRREDRLQVRFLTLPHPSLALEIADAARQNPDQLEKAAGQLKLKVKTTDLFKPSKPAPELGLSERMLGSIADLKPGEISRPLPSASRQWLILRVDKKEVADEKQLASVRADLEKELLDQKRLEAYFTWYQDLLKRANPRRGKELRG